MSLPTNEIYYDAFLSHSHTDADIVTKIAEQLEDQEGLKVFLDKWNMVPGSDCFIPELRRGQDRSKTCVVFIGNVTPKGWYLEEIHRALQRHISDKNFRVFPVLLPGASPDNIPDFLELRSWVDFRKGIEDNEAFHTLVAGIKGVEPGRLNSRGNVNFSPGINEHIKKMKAQLLATKEIENLIEKELLIEMQRRITEPIFSSDIFAGNKFDG